MKRREPTRDRKSEPLWIDLRDTLAIHDRILATHGGAVGVRDQGLLEPALARPRHHAYSNSADVVELATLYTAGLVRNHPFFDGNKRTGFVIGVLFLELHGFDFTATEAEAAQAVMALAAGSMHEAEYGEWLRGNSRPSRRGR